MWEIEKNRGFAEFDDLVKAEHERIDREMSGKMSKVPTKEDQEERRMVKHRSGKDSGNMRRRSNSSSSDDEKSDFVMRVNRYGRWRVNNDIWLLLLLLLLLLFLQHFFCCCWCCGKSFKCSTFFIM